MMIVGLTEMHVIVCDVFNLGVVDDGLPAMADSSGIAVQVLGREEAENLPQNLLWKVGHAALGLQQHLAAAQKPKVSVRKRLHLLFVKATVFKVVIVPEHLCRHPLQVVHLLPLRCLGLSHRL